MLRTRQKGQGLVEFSLILPILLLFLLGIIEGGRIVWAFITIQNAAREAARYAVTGRPFACGTPQEVPGADLSVYCDDAVQGEPWSTQVLTSTRVEAIKKVAEDYARPGLSIKYFATQDENDFYLNEKVPGAFGVNVIGQDADTPGKADYAGQPGWNVRVQVYYNIEMLDPIYGVIAQYIHLNAQTELQNEGIDPNATGYQGGITYQDDNCYPNCGGGSTPFILVQDEFGDLSEPQGGKFTVSVNDHQPNTAYKVWFVHDASSFSSSLDFTTDALGGKLVNFIISASAPPTADWEYKIYTTLASNTDPVAACNGDLPANTPCFRVEIGNASIEARNINKDKQLQQPLTTARWPISSSIPIYLYGHDTNENYTIKFDGLTAGPAPGSFWYNGLTQDFIPTDGVFGTNDNNIPAYYIATDHTPGLVEITSEDAASTEVASTTIELISASIDIAGETVDKRHPAGDILYLTLRNHAPLQQYEIFYDDGITPPAVVRANANGELAPNYVVPDGIHEPGVEPPISVEIFTKDYGRGNNPNKIASRTVSIFTPLEPYINVPGGPKFPAGSPILIQLRRHLPNTDYQIYLQQGSADSPSFSELINGATITTDGSGAYDMNYTVPSAYVGFFVIRSFEPTDLTTAVAEYNIEFTGNPYITIDDSSRWPPGSEITIRLRNHVPGFSYDVWLDRGGPQETFLGTVIMDASGEGTIDYTIPQDMPINISPGYLIQSYLGNTLIAETALEIEPADLQVTNIDVPNVTFDIQIPITLTVYNDSPVTVTNTYFDTDIYVDPLVAPNSTDSGLPPGTNKNWLSYVPPYGSVLVDDEIVLFGSGSHEVFARADTTDWVAETDETNNVAFKNLDAACPVEIADEFPGDGLSEWTQTDYGDSGPACPTLPGLPPVGVGGSPIAPTPLYWPGSSVQGFTVVYDPLLVPGETINQSRTGFATQNAGDPDPNALAVRIDGRQNDNPVSIGAELQFTNSQPDVTISFEYLLGMTGGMESNEWAEYYLYIDGAPYDGGTGRLLQMSGPNGSGNAYTPAALNGNWPTFNQTFTLNPVGSHTLMFAVKAGASGNTANRSISANGEHVYGYMDSLLINESTGPALPPPDPTGTIWSTHYDAGTDLFNPAPNTFYNLTSNPAAANPTLNYVGGEGGWANGSLYMKMGETGGANYTDMTGGWSRDFTVPAGSGCVTVQGYYRLKFPSNYESAEEAEVLIAVDDGTSPRVLERVSGGAGSDYDSGWVAFNESFSLPPGTHTLILGGYNNRATEDPEITEIWFDDVYVVDTGSAGTSGSTQTESSGTLILTNNGSGALTNDDNGSSAGYHFMHQTVGTGPFEVYVRVDQPPPNGGNGMAGLEIRGNYSDGTSTKMMFVHRASDQLTVYSRVSGSSAVNKKTNSSISAPVWLKISRNGDAFEFYRVVSASDTPPADWGSVWYTLNNFSMPDSVEVGLVNAPGSSGAMAAHFKHFHVCASSAPGGSSSGGQGYLGNQCGQVEENGNGQVVVDAVNTIINQSGGGHTWTPVEVDNVLGEPKMSGLEADPDSGADLAAGAGPHATYQVNFQSAGTFYVWVAGWGPNGSGNSVHVGLNGTAAGTIDGFPTGGSAPGWVKMAGSVSINTGINTIDLWAKEDGTRVFKILLTQDAGFVPSPDGMSQSACTIIVEPHVPPLMEKCVDPIQLGSFEGTFMDVSNEWTVAYAARFSNVSYDSFRGVGFLAAASQKPLLYQTFQIPDLSPVGVLTNTTAMLKMNVGVDLNGSSTPADTLYFALRRESDDFDLVPPVLVADGQDRTPGVPDLDPLTYSTDQWIEFNQNVLGSVNPVNVLKSGENVRALFYVPNPGVDTAFYLDNISLSFCSTQSVPDTTAGTGKVSGIAQVGGTPTEGVNVWAYAYSEDGSDPGPVSQTYSIQDGSYRFYNLQPGKYLIYAEIQTAQGTFSASRLIQVTSGGDITNLVLNVDTA